MFYKSGLNETNIFRTRFGNSMLLICYDMSFGEFYIRPGSKDVDIVLVSSAWIKMEKMPYLSGRKFENHIILPRAIAVQNRCLVAVASPVGNTRLIVPNFPMFGDGVIPFETEFCGNSLICDHMGTILIMADETSNTALFCPCSTQLSQQMKKIDFRDYGVNQIAIALSKEDIV